MRGSRIAGTLTFFEDTGSSAYANAFRDEWHEIALEKSETWGGLDVGTLYVTLTYIDGKRPSRIYKINDGIDVKVYVDREESRVDSQPRAKADARAAWALVARRYWPESAR